MPDIVYKNSNGIQRLCIVHFPETYAELFEDIYLYDDELKMFNSFNHPKRKKEFIATRFILQNLHGSNDKIIYDMNGKPYIQGGFISISHSKDYIGVSLSAKQTGLDIECISERILKIKHKFLNEAELEIIGNNLDKLHCCWTIKESIFKVIGLPGIDFKNDIVIKPFEVNDGEASAIYKEVTYNLKVHVVNDLAMAYI